MEGEFLPKVNGTARGKMGGPLEDRTYVMERKKVGLAEVADLSR